MKKLLLVLGVILALLAAVVLVRMAQFASRQVEVEPVTDIQIDAQQVAEHLVQALRFRTVSPQDLEQVNAEEFLALHGFFEQAFPQVHTTLAKEIVADYSLSIAGPGETRTCSRSRSWVTWTPSRSTRPPKIPGRIRRSLEAVEMLFGQGFQPRRTVYLVFRHNEETTG